MIYHIYEQKGDQMVVRKTINVKDEIYDKYEKYKSAYGSDFSKVANMALDKFLNDMMGKKK